MGRTQKVSTKEINRLAIPAMISGLAEPLISLTDLAIVGSIPKDSDAIIGAVGVSGAIISALIWVFAQTKSSVSAYVSKAVGAKDLKNVSTVVPQVLLVMVLSSILIGLACFFGKNLIFNSVFELDLDTFNYAKSYFSIRVLGFPLTILTFSIFGLFRGLQNTSWAMQIALVGGLSNILLDLILVKGWGIPSMGVEGAAWASVFSQIIMLVLALVFVWKKVEIQFKWVSKIHKDVKSVLVLTLNYALRTIALNVALILANRFASGYGKDELAVHTVLFNLWLFSAFLLDGYANAGNALSGKFLGAKDWSNLKLLKKKTVLLSLMVGVSTGLLFLLAKDLIGMLFLKKEVTAALFSVYVVMIVIIQPFNAIAFAMDGIFKGLGEARFLRNLLFIATGLIFIPTIYLADYYIQNTIAIWIAFIAWMISRSLIPWMRFGQKFVKFE